MNERKGSGSPPIGSSPQWTDFPAASRERFCEAFLKEAAVLFEDPEVRKDFEQWKIDREKKKSAHRRQAKNTLPLHRGAGVVIVPSQHFRKET